MERRVEGRCKDFSQNHIDAWVNGGEVGCGILWVFMVIRIRLKGMNLGQN